MLLGTILALELWEKHVSLAQGVNMGSHIDKLPFVDVILDRPSTSGWQRDSTGFLVLIVDPARFEHDEFGCLRIEDDGTEFMLFDNRSGYADSSDCPRVLGRFPDEDTAKLAGTMQALEWGLLLEDEEP